MLPAPQLHPMPHVRLPAPCQQQQQRQSSSVKQEAHVNHLAAIKREGHDKVKGFPSAAAQLYEHPTISVGTAMPVHITLAAGAGNKSPPSHHGRSSRAGDGNCVDRGGSAASATAMPAVKTEGRSTQHSPLLNSEMLSIAKQGSTAKSEPQHIKDQSSSAQPRKPSDGGNSQSKASTLLQPPSLPAGKAATAQTSLFEPLPMSRAEKLRRGLLSNSRS